MADRQRQGAPGLEAGTRQSYPLAIVCSLPSEWSVLARQLEERKPLDPHLPRAWSARLGATRFALLETGVGLERAEERTRALLERVEARTLLSTGFGGALLPELRTGELVVAETISRLASEAESASPGSDPALLAAALAHPAEFPTRGGGFVSGPAVVREVSERAALATRHGAALVDMESAGVARAITDWPGRALFVRAVLDEFTTELPRKIETFVDAQGRPRAGAICRSLLARPRELGRLLDLGRRSRRSAAAIASLISWFIREHS